MEREKLQELIKQMTLEEKASLCSGADFWHTESVDRLGIPANFQKFRAAMGATRENTDAETFLFLKTDFLRQRNRLCGELDRIIEQIDYQLLKWNCNSIQK